MSDRALARTQAASGLVFALFLVLHLTTSLAAVVGPSSYDAVLAAMRHYYRLPVIEVAGVVGAGLVHVTAGVWRIVRRRREDKARGHAHAVPFAMKLHRWTGWYMMTAFAGHVIATRTPSLVFGMQPNAAFLSTSLLTAPWFFYPYYALFAFSGGVHLLHGLQAAPRVLGMRMPSVPRRALPVLAAVWAAAALAIVLSLGGVLHSVDMSAVAPWKALLDRLLG
jgi:succinate dehydrogenase/fumarate reductase cytochrome b subunit